MDNSICVSERVYTKTNSSLTEGGRRQLQTNRHNPAVVRGMCLQAELNILTTYYVAPLYIHYKTIVIFFRAKATKEKLL